MGEFECGKCDKSFSSEEALEQHKQDYDHSKLSKCSKCGEKFSSEKSLKEHRKKHWGPVKTHLLDNQYVVGGIILVGAVIVLGVGLNSLPSDTDQISSTASEDVDKTITINGGEYYFTPSDTEVNSTDKIRVSFINRGSITHNLIITDSGKGTGVLQPRQSESFTFNASKSGELPLKFECTLPGHSEQGMVGRFTSP